MHSHNKWSFRQIYTESLKLSPGKIDNKDQSHHLIHIILFPFFLYIRCACTDICQANQMLEHWTLDMDTALVQYVNKLCYHLAIAPSRLHPHELYITDAERSSTTYSPLQGNHKLTILD